MLNWYFICLENQHCEIQMQERSYLLARIIYSVVLLSKLQNCSSVQLWLLLIPDESKLSDYSKLWKKIIETMSLRCTLDLEGWALGENTQNSVGFIQAILWNCLKYYGDKSSIYYISRKLKGWILKGKPTQTFLYKVNMRIPQHKLIQKVRNKTLNVNWFNSDHRTSISGQF